LVQHNPNQQTNIMNTSTRHISKWTDEHLEAKRSFFKENTRVMRELAQELNTILIEYNSVTRDDIKSMADQIIGMCKGDWREHYIKTAKKSELREKMLLVISRTIEDNDAWLKAIETEAAHRTNIVKVKQESEKIREWFYAKVLPHKDDYICGFDKISDGIRQWECLEELCLTGTVTAENIGQYGIELD